ncbi:MAG TPA: 1,2-phenylacetyl-CoA epoxidase subunit PaaD [Anaerolineales bacterium]|nr:1,2-phenylacetyl-CoA epoxidase subunit PaaD [Anaerolineales bacterium]
MKSADIPTLDQVWETLADIQDPEIPVLSLVDLGIIRHVSIEGSSVTVRLTPTFAGCPALHVMRQAILDRLSALGFEQVRAEVVLDPPWTTDDLSPEARGKLRAFGLAPPARPAAEAALRLEEAVECPHCGSMETDLRNAFGPTPCRTIRFCHACRQPFEGFKPL